MQEEERPDTGQAPEAPAEPEQANAQPDIPRDHEPSVIAEDTVDLGEQQSEPLPATPEEAQAEIQRWRDQAMRAMADVENVRLRAQRDIEKAHKFALEKFAADLLPVVDSLEQALAAANPEDDHIKPMLDGIKLTHKLFLDTLARFNIEVVDPHGEPFNPQFHEAMSMIESADCEPNTVLQVFQKGYLLNGRLVRAAKVVVSRAAASQQIDEQA